MSDRFTAAPGRTVVSRASAEAFGKLTHLVVDVGRRQGATLARAAPRLVVGKVGSRHRTARPREYAPPMSSPAAGVPEAAVARAAPRLVRLNVVVGLAHLAQAILILILAKAAALPVNVRYMNGPPGAGRYRGPAALFDLRIDLAVAAFLLLAAADHLIVVSPLRRRWYLANVLRGVNPARWWEYSVSASIMVVLIAMLAGVTDAIALIALFGVNTAMILFGLLMERANAARDSVDWRPFIYGCIAGAVPWVAIGLQLGVSQANSRGVPGFVFVIFLTLFLLFNTFAVNMWLQYRGRGRWADPAFAERVYLILSLVAKSALAWQVYAGALAGR